MWILDATLPYAGISHDGQQSPVCSIQTSSCAHRKTSLLRTLPVCKISHWAFPSKRGVHLLLCNSIEACLILGCEASCEYVALCDFLEKRMPARDICSLHRQPSILHGRHWCGLFHVRQQYHKQTHPQTNGWQHSTSVGKELCHSSLHSSFECPSLWKPAFLGPCMVSTCDIGTRMMLRPFGKPVRHILLPVLRIARRHSF